LNKIAEIGMDAGLKRDLILIAIGGLVGWLGGFATLLLERWLRNWGLVSLRIRGWRVDGRKKDSMGGWAPVKMDEAEWGDYFLDFDINNRKERIVSLCRPRVVFYKAGAILFETRPESRVAFAFQRREDAGTDVIDLLPHKVTHFKWGSNIPQENWERFRSADAANLTFEDAEGREQRHRLPWPPEEAR
jgi:hypothetical protein